MGKIAPHELTSLALLGTSAGDGETGRRTGSASADLHEAINAIGLALQDASAAEAARLRHRLGYLAFFTGDVRGKALEAFSLMLEGASKAGDRGLEALAHCGLAAALDFVGERRESLKHAHKAKRLAKKLGEPRILALALNAEAQFYKENGDNPRAFELFKQIEAIGLDLDDRQLVMGAHIGMGRTAPMEHATVGIGHYEQAIEIAKATGDEPALALCLTNLSDWMIYTGAYDEAMRLRDESLALSRALGLRPLIGRCLIGQAKIHTILGDLDKARELLDRGFPVVVSTGDLEGDLHSQLNLAYLYVAAGDVPRAVDLYRQVLERSLAAPDHACAVFAQQSLELLGDGGVPKPGILPDRPVQGALDAAVDFELGDLEPGEADLVGAVGGARSYSYPTGDMTWQPSP